MELISFLNGWMKIIYIFSTVEILTNKKKSKYKDYNKNIFFRSSSAYETCTFTFRKVNEIVMFCASTGSGAGKREHAMIGVWSLVFIIFFLQIKCI